MSAKLKLHNLTNVNTVLSMLYDKDGNYRAGFKPEEFYNAILLDTLKYGEENFVHLKYAEPLTIKKGFKTARFRRWAGMTPTLRPLLEGVPPTPDKHAYETLEIGNVWSFGRWSEYSDQIDYSVVSDIISERSLQYGELANQIKELYARKVWLSAPNEFYANFKAGIADLEFGDVITLDDLRFLVQRMKRMLVKPIGGKFNYICSPEWVYELIDDPRVKTYMEIEQTTGKLWSTGEPFDLFELKFIPTMLDEFAYPDTEFPGLYEDASGNELVRYYAIDGKYVYYFDATAAKGRTQSTGVTYLSDGTAVEDRIEWKMPKLTADDNVKKSERKINAATGLIEYTTPAQEKATTALNNLTWIQLPVLRGILFGDEAMVKLNVEGVSDAPKMIVKPLGSSGVADPLDQRQSVGFRVDGFGLAIKRPEAVCITYGLCRNAALAAIMSETYNTIHGDYTPMFDANSTSNINHVDEENNVQVMNVDGVNNVRNAFAPFSKTVAYAEGEIVKHEGKTYKFIQGHKGDWNAAHVVEIIVDL